MLLRAASHDAAIPADEHAPVEAAAEAAESSRPPAEEASSLDAPATPRGRFESKRAFRRALRIAQYIDD